MITDKYIFPGSYQADDVNFLLKRIDLAETNLEQKEQLIQSGKKHYSQMLSPEYVPSAEYLQVFYRALALNGERMAKDLLLLAKLISGQERPVIVSLARAGTPVGVLLTRILRKFFSRETTHYSVSIIREKGLDQNALAYITKRHQSEQIFFLDGWTGKGVISRELKKSVGDFNQKNETTVPNQLYVLADISGQADFSATTEDYLIPSAVLNSTISGLISRTILNEQIDPVNDFHGCKFYEEYREMDLSGWFVDKIMEKVEQLADKKLTSEKIAKESLKERCENFIKEIMTEYRIKNVNHLKPGIGETTRVLLRRVPERVLIRDKKSAEVEHLLLLCQERGVPVEELSQLPYKAVGIIAKMEKEN